MRLLSPLPTFGYATTKVSTPLRRHSSSLQRALRRCEEPFVAAKSPSSLRKALRPDEVANILGPINICVANHFSLHPPFFYPFCFLSRFLCVFLQICPLYRPPCLLGSPPQPNGNDLAPPHGRNHPLQKIHIDSFPGRPSRSIISRYSIARSSWSAVFPHPMCSSTSPSRTTDGRPYVRLLFPEWPL